MQQDLKSVKHELDGAEAARRMELLEVLSSRLDREALLGLDSLSGGQDNFMVFMLNKIVGLLETVCSRLDASWEARDFAAMADEVHKLRASVRYVGAMELDALVSECEPLLRKHDGTRPGAKESRVELLAAQTLRESRALHDWLREVLPRD